jgi:hypothetical protein
MAGSFDTRFVEERFAIEEAQEGDESHPDIAAIIATIVAHQQSQRAAQVVQRGQRDASNWKWVGRWERIHH